MQECNSSDERGKSERGEDRFWWLGQFGFLGFIKQRFFLFRNEKVAK
jgi:hypothetical protein